jgi:hypothetical protein
LLVSEFFDLPIEEVITMDFVMQVIIAGYFLSILINMFDPNWQERRNKGAKRQPWRRKY